MTPNMWCDRRLANEETWYLIPPKDANMRIPEVVRRCVTYLGVDSTQSTQPKKWGGTGFIVHVKLKRLPDVSVFYLITAKHVADHLKSPNFWLRMNSKAGKAISINAPDPTTAWIFHPTDKAADIAAIPIGLDAKHVDFAALSTNIILTEEERKKNGIGIGDEVFITGLFVHHHGNQKNMPIVRSGTIAMIPDERIPIKNFGDMEAYLIEARSIGGLSGSPVFVLYHDRELKMATVQLLGLIHGHWDVGADFIVDGAVPDAGIRAGVNVGIAIVTPASKILDIINSPGEVARRAQYEEIFIAKNSPIPDKNDPQTKTFITLDTPKRLG